MNQIPELLCQIFVFLTHNDLNNVDLSSKLFHSVVAHIHQREKGIGLLNQWRYWHFFMKSLCFKNTRPVNGKHRPLYSDHKLSYLSYFSDQEGLHFKVYQKFIRIKTFGNYVIVVPLDFEIQRMKKLHYLPTLHLLVIHGKSNTYVFNYRTLSIHQQKRSCYSSHLCIECRSLLEKNEETCTELEMWSLMHQSLWFQPMYDMTRFRIITPGSTLKHQIVKNNQVHFRVDLCPLTKNYVVLGTKYLMIFKGNKINLVNVESKTKIRVRCRFIEKARQSFETLKVWNSFTHFGYVFCSWWGFYQQGQTLFVAEKLKVDNRKFLPIRCPFEKRYILTNCNYNSSVKHRRLKTREHGRVFYGTHTHHYEE